MRALLVSVSLLVSVVCHAQDFEAAAKHFQAAQQAFSEKHFRHAAAEFEATYYITKDPLLHYNIAEAWHQGGEGNKAVAAYKAYLSANTSSQDRSDVQKRIRAIEANHFVVVDKSLPDAETSPAVAAPATPPASPALAANTAALAAQPVASPTPPVAVPVAAPAPAQNDSTPPNGLFDEAPPSRMRTVAWIGVAATVATLTAGTIFGLTAQARADDVNRALTYVNASGQPATFNMSAQLDYQSRVDDGQLYNRLGISFLTIGAAIAATTTVLFVLDIKRSKKTQEQVWLRPYVLPSSALLQAGWKF